MAEQVSEKAAQQTLEKTAGQPANSLGWQPVEPPAAKPKPKRRRRWGRILGITGAVLGVVLLVALFAGYRYVSNVAQPMPEALAALESDSAVTVSQGSWFEFVPTAATPTTGFIFYPGGLVDPRAYAPPAHALAAQGYFVAITPMPFNLAIIDPQRAKEVIVAHPEIQHWVIGGHSLGGTSAAMFAGSNPDAVDGLVFWAAYPASGSLAGREDLAVTSISGSLDGLATPAKIEASVPQLPGSTEFVVIDGGNHAQFGYYGDQDGDNPAAITREAQQAQAIEATARTLAGVQQAN